MSTKTILLAGLCLAAFAASAPSALAQRVSGSRNVVDPSRMDGVINLYQDGVRHYQQGQYKVAQQDLNAFLARVGEHAGGNFMMGLVQLELGDMKEAKKYMFNAVKFDPNMASARGYLGALEIIDGNAQGAMDQKTALDAQKAACAGTCPKAKDIDQAIQRIIDNANAAQQQAAPAPAPAG